MKSYWFPCLLLLLALLPVFGCNSQDKTRPELLYDDKRAADELRRLEQMSQIEEVLGHDTHRLKSLLAETKETPPAELKHLLVRCRDEYLRGLKNKSGVPLGGIGAGSVELWPDGALHDWRIAGNWDLAKEADFSLFAVRTTSTGRKPEVRILQNSRWAGRRGTQKINYDGRFPFVFLGYGGQSSPVSIKAEAFSPFIPHDAENSCLPVASFTFEVTNNSDANVHVALLSAIGTAPLLENGTARFDKREGIASVRCESEGNAIALSTTAETASWASGWDDNFLPPEFESGGHLFGRKAQENGRIALCSEADIAPHQSKKMSFLLSWYFPDQRQRPTHGYKMEEKFKTLGATQEAEANKYIGRRYNKFGSLENINQYFLNNFSFLHSETLLWVNSIYDGSLDESLKSLLCNSLYPLFKTSFWTEDGLFNILESPNCCANPDCVHVRYYGSIPVALLFPELDQQVLRRLAKYRGPFGGEEAGQIPEQFYGFSLELPFGRPLLQNNLSFVLMVYRDYLWTGNKDFLTEMWPAVKDAMALAVKADTDGDGLPDNVGIKQSYDEYDMGDSPTYTSVIWLASLRAAEQMARSVKEPQKAKAFADIFDIARTSVENNLWNGQFYGLGEGENSRICFADALNGQWYADMLGLGDLLDPIRIQKTLATIFKYNHPATSYGIVNGFIPGKGIDYPEQVGYFQTQTASVWTGTTFAVASLGLYRGFYDEPLEAVREVHDNYAFRLGNLWNMRESNDAESGLPMAWPYYYRPMSMWAVLLGMEGFRYNGVEAQLTVRPPEKVTHMKAPLIVPGALAEIDFRRERNSLRLSLSVQKGVLPLKEIHLPPLAMKQIKCLSAAGAISVNPGKEEIAVLFPTLRRVSPGNTLDIELVGTDQ
jgi:uncharacterized protein (DUF608 family)